MPILSRIQVTRGDRPITSPHGTRAHGVTYIPLPRDLWEPRPEGRDGYLDTLAVSSGIPVEGPDHTWMVHRPDLHGGTAEE
jgi:hypothetical protein